MIVGLLSCDHVRPEFSHLNGDYTDMFESLLGDRLQLRHYALVDGEFPQSTYECDGWITTGSHRSVYEDVPWINRFAALTRSIISSDSRLFGVCFGHQMIAHAQGGRVEQAPQGWGVGVKEVAVTEQQPWMVPKAESFRILNSHRDQITQLPDGSRVIGSNPHCPVSALAIEDRVVGIQGHPEFVPEYSAALMEARKGTLIPEPIVNEGLATLGSPPDRSLLADWIVAFFAI